MQNSKKSSSSSTPVASNRDRPKAATNGKTKTKSPLEGDYKYLGRLVTRERPIITKSKSLHDNLVYSSNARKNLQRIYQDDSMSSDEDADDLSKALGVIRINDRHIREIYRIPTPPPEIKRVVHRLRSPEPKIIERVYVHRPPRDIIENIIQVPPEKTRIINREKYLKKSKPIIRTKVIHLKEDDNYQSRKQQQTYIPPQQYYQQPTTLINPPQQHYQQQPRALANPPQLDQYRQNYIQSALTPPDAANSQQLSYSQIPQASCYSFDYHK